MQLLTKELERTLPALDTETDENSTVFAHFFNPVGRGDWYALTYDQEQRLFFGYVSIFKDHNDELGYFSLDELESITLPMGLKIERDLHWTAKALKDVQTGVLA